MIQRRPTTTSIVSMIIVAIIFCFMAVTTVKSLQYIVNRKEATGRVLSHNVPDPKHPTTYLVKTRFYNEYQHDSTNLNVRLKNYSGNIPNNITLYYDDKSEVHAYDQPQITWSTVIWKSLICLLLLAYIAMEATTFTISESKETKKI